MPAERDVFWVEHYNLVPSARIMARDAAHAFVARLRTALSGFLRIG